MGQQIKRCSYIFKKMLFSVSYLPSNLPPYPKLAIASELELFFAFLMLWLFVGPNGIYLLDFYCSGIQFYILLIPYLCFISFLYLDLYVLGDDA